MDINAPLFYERLDKLRKHLEAHRSEAYGDAAAVAIVAGTAPDEDAGVESLNVTSTALQVWLLGYECPETIVLYSESECIVHTSASKVKKLRAIADYDKAPFNVEFVARNKQDNKENIERLLRDLHGKTAGVIASERPSGAFAEQWTSLLGGADDIKRHDVEVALLDVMSVKDADEVRTMRTAAGAADRILRKALLAQIESTIDQELKMSHRAVSSAAEKMVADKVKFAPATFGDASNIEVAFLQVQSDGEYELRARAANTERNLSWGAIVAMVGARFKSYAAHVARTYLIDPDEQQKTRYGALLKAEAHAIKAVKPGATLGSVAAAARAALRESDEKLAAHMSTHCGQLLGISAADSEAFRITEGNERVFRAGQVYAVQVGVDRLAATKADAEPYALFLCDVVLVTDDGAEVLTKAVRDYGEISYFLGDEESDSAEKRERKAKLAAEAERRRAEGGAKKRRNGVDEEDDDDDDDDDDFGGDDDGGPARGIARRRPRRAVAERANIDQAEEQRRREHQRELRKQADEEALKRLQKHSAEEDDVHVRGAHEFSAYETTSEFPRDADKTRVHVDERRKVVLCPVYGTMVPFHVSTIKTATAVKNEDYLKIQFITPVSTIASDPATKIFIAPEAVFVKELSYRITDEQHLNNIARKIKEVRKQFTNAQKQARLQAEIVPQEDLQLSKARGPRLQDVFMRPTLTGRKTFGTLEAHENGFRFRSVKGGRLDVLYANIKHAFFQPAEREVMTVIHFHLKNDIMIGKKKHKDVQFCIEVMEASQTLDARNMNNDGIEEEQRARELRIRINKEYENFVRKVDMKVEFDVPYHDLGFRGVPQRSAVQLLPTVHCLINVIEQPFFVLTLDEVERVHLERIQFRLKEFDIVFIFKDYTRNPHMVSAVPTTSLDTIRQWLDSCSLPFTEGPTNLNWNAIMKTIREDLAGFFEDGGWAFLDLESEDEEAAAAAAAADGDEANGADDEEDSDAFTMDSDAEESDDDMSDFEEDDDEEESDEESDVDSVDEDSENNWEALEKKAARADAKRVRKEMERDGALDEEEEPARKKKKK